MNVGVREINVLNFGHVIEVKIVDLSDVVMREITRQGEKVLNLNW